MKVDNSKNAEQLLQVQLMTEILKRSMGDSNSFALVMESLTKAMTDSGSKMDLSKLGLGEQDLSKLGYGAGERLEGVKKYVSNSISSGNGSIEDAIDRASRKYGIDKDLIRAVIKQESDFDTRSTSGAGAMGLMQLMPGTAEELGVSNPYDIFQNVEGGTKYLKGLLNMYKNNKELALAAYNAGPGTLQNRGVRTVSDIQRLPYETRDYVKKVMKYYGK